MVTQMRFFVNIYMYVYVYRCVCMNILFVNVLRKCGNKNKIDIKY